MIKMSTFFPNEKGKPFDKEYFMKTHVPLAEKAFDVYRFVNAVLN